MYLAIPPKRSCASAWIAAADAVRRNGGEAHNVVIDIENPLARDDTDNAIVSEADKFLRQHHAYPIASVANTIFPEALLRRHGPKDLYGAYQRVLPRIKRATRDWGRYFDRMTRWTKLANPMAVEINPLDDLIRFMRNQVKNNRTYRNVYEVTIYDPTRDAGKVSNRQCLSFLSFKLTTDGRLLLTAVYRNHTYISRALGNFIGLGRLQRFVASETGLAVGSLTCVSTHAAIDYGTKRKDGVDEGWTRTQAENLIDRCARLVAPDLADRATWSDGPGHSS